MGSPEVFVAFLTTYCVGNLIGSALAKPLTDWKCKVSIFWWTNAALAVVSVAMFFVPMHATVLMFGFIFVIGVLHQLVTPIQWVMMSDTVDYGEWTNGKRLTGISFAGTLFVLKLGPGAGRGDDRLDAGRRRLRRGGQNPEQRDHQYHYRPVYAGTSDLLRAERHHRQTLLHAENPLPDQKSCASWRRVRAAISRSLKTCRSVKNCRTKRTKA